MIKPLHVAFVSQDLCFGGTQRQLVELAGRLDRTRFSPEIWTLTGPTDLEAFAQEKDVPVLHLGTARTPRPGFLTALPRAMLRRRPDVMVPGTAIPNIWCRIFGRLFRIPVLGTVRGGGGPRSQHEWLLWRLADHLMCNSTPLFTVLRELGVPEDRLTYIANGVDTDRYAPGPVPLEERAPLVLSVGRLVENKNQSLLLRAFELVLREVPEARLRIVGDGKLEAALKAQIAASPLLRTAAEVLPAKLDVRPQYREARIFALSSIREGQPNVLLEAMSSGLPAVSTDVGGACVDVMGDAGLVSPQNDAAALARNMIRLLRDPALCRRLGEAGRARMQANFSFKVMVAAHEAIFERLCRPGGKS